MYFDTHAHYDDEAFDADRRALLARLFAEEPVSYILNPGCDRESSDAALALAEEFDGVYAAVGWHPHEALSYDEQSPDYLRAAAGHEKVRAIGEIGLDYHYDFAPKERQQAVFRSQLAVARELGLPAIVHDREAHADALAIAQEFSGLRGVFHCYSGSAEMAKELVRMGWYLSFTGAVTFKNARRALETIAAIPMERILLETDSPYLSPEPFRGRRNDSSRLPLIAEAVGRVRGLTPEETARITTENAKFFFGI